MKRLALIILVFSVFISGCRTFQKTGEIKTTPEGANVFFYEPATGKSFPIGIAPTQGQINRGSFDLYLVAEKEGYERYEVLLPQNPSVNFNINLEKRFSDQIKNESKALPTDFKKRVLKVLNSFEKILESPRMLASQTFSDAKSLLQELMFDFEKQRDSATIKTFKKLTETFERLTNLPNYKYDSSDESSLVLKAKKYIFDIRSGLDLDF